MEYHECQTYSVEQSAGVLGISRTHAYAMTETGELPCLRLGQRKRITKQVIKEILQGKTFRKKDNDRNENIAPEDENPDTDDEIDE
jgi:excisionase family DNA binding protein